MRRWTRLTNALLALMLALGFATPMAAESGESSSTQSGGSITLTAGQCTIRMITSSEIDFGTFKWDGYAYVPNEDVGSQLVRYAVAPARKGCEMSIQTDGLFRVGSGESAVIGPEYLGVKMLRTEGGVSLWVPFDPSGSLSVPWNNRMNRNNVTLGIVNMPNDIPSGEYKGTFTFTVSNAQ